MPYASIEAIGRRPRRSAASSLVTTTAAAPSEICDALPAVTVPSCVNAGFSAASDSTLVSGLIPSSRSKTTGRPWRCGTSTGTTSSASRPESHALGRAPVRPLGPRVLLRALDAELAADDVGPLAHVVVVEARPQTVVDHRVDHRRVAQARAVARLRDQVRGVGHGLHATRHGDLELARADHLVGHRDRGQPREADLVHGDRGDLFGDARADRGLPGGDLPVPAWITWPMITYSTWSAATPDRSSAARIAIAPRSIASKPASEPRNFPIGVRAPATMTDLVMGRVYRRARARISRRCRDRTPRSPTTAISAHRCWRFRERTSARVATPIPGRADPRCPPAHRTDPRPESSQHGCGVMTR